MKVKILFTVLAVCLISTPAMAELFSIGVISPKTVYNATDATTGTFTAEAYKNLSSQVQIASVSGSSSSVLGQSATLIWGNDLGSFSLEMAISSVMGDGISTPYSAVGIGSFTLTDIDGDTITADFTGKWVRLATQNFFDGILTNVLFSDGGDKTFDGSGMSSIDIGLLAGQPWSGGITELVTNTSWFDAGDFDETGGGVSLTVVPVPAALILGVLSLGSMGLGLKLRKLA